MADDVRAKAALYMKQIPPLGQEITSRADTEKDAPFKKLTNHTQASLERDWAAGKDTTSCNDFIGTFTAAMVGQYLGMFQLEATLKRLGKAHSYVKSVPGARPSYGDVFKAKSFHMGVFLDFEGNMINTVEGGQGGKTLTYDVVKRKRQVFDNASYEGWCDIALFSAKAPAPKIAEYLGPVQDSLVGWWQVWWHGQAYYYHLGPDRKARWTKSKPHSATQPPPVAAMDTGPMLIDAQGGVIVQWAGPGSWTDVFTRDPRDAKKMTGLRNETLKLVANRL